MSLLNSIISRFNVKRIEQIGLYSNFATEIQNETLNKLIRQAELTEWGLKHNYSQIKNQSDFQKAVAINDYNGLKPWINRVREGENNVLWHSKIKWFAKSSGTTEDKSKYIPVSREALEECHFRGGKDTFTIYNKLCPNTELFLGKSLSIGGSYRVCQNSVESYDGDLSAILIENLPFWAELYRIPEKEVTLMEDWEKKIDLLIHKTIHENVTNITGVPSWILVLFKKMLNVTGKSNISEIWQNLELYIHGGISFTPYRAIFNELIPSTKMKYLETYNASEGFFAIQNDFSTDDMLLMLDLGVFYEFIPVKELNSPTPEVVMLKDIEIGENYALVISTNSGLWRYLIGDTIIFTQRNPYKIRISGRTKHFINAFGEELIVENADKALEIACQRTDSKIRDYTVAPVFMSDKSKGSHQWLVEFSIIPQDIKHFVEILDIELKSLNSDYEAKRYKNMSLDVPVLEVLPDGTFYNWLKAKGKLGGQNKVPRLSNNRDYVDSILEIIGKV